MRCDEKICVSVLFVLVLLFNKKNLVSDVVWEKGATGQHLIAAAVACGVE